MHWSQRTAGYDWVGVGGTLHQKVLQQDCLLLCQFQKLFLHVHIFSHALCCQFSVLFSFCKKTFSPTLGLQIHLLGCRHELPRHSFFPGDLSGIQRITHLSMGAVALQVQKLRSSMGSRCTNHSLPGSNDDILLLPGFRISCP